MPLPLYGVVDLVSLSTTITFGMEILQVLRVKMAIMCT